MWGLVYNQQSFTAKANNWKVGIAVLFPRESYLTRH